MKDITKNTYQYHEDIYKFKSIENKPKKDSQLILLTSINPTSHGEGKTTTLIGLTDAFNYYNYDAIGCLRQPSIGPYLGFKGGATGSGNCSIKNDSVINLGLTGDFDKIALVNNLIASIVENELFQKLEDIDLKTFRWRRCVDLNDRSLREIKYKVGDESHSSSYTITAASDIMALFTLCNNEDDFINKLGNVVICKTKKGKDIKIKDLNIMESIREIIHNALIPNLVFTKRNNPIIMHGGPFANIAHGTSSLISIKQAMSEAKYTFVECGFGSDLGLEKFINIVTRQGNIVPNLVVYAISFASLKTHGENNNEKMVEFLKKHLSICDSFNLNNVVLLNKFANDNDEEVESFIKYAQEQGIKIMISNLYNDPLNKSKKIVDFILNNLQNNKIKYTYKLEDNLEAKIDKVSKSIYGAKKVVYSKKAKEILNNNNKLNYYLCIAKDYKEIIPTDKVLRVKDIYINHAANLIVPITGNIFLMPGLPKKPNAKSK